jgi:transposase
VRMTRAGVLTDEMWARIEPVLPPVKGAMGRPMREHRLLVEGAIYRYRTGIPWRDLPPEFGPWQTVWKRHHRFCLDGTWDRVLTMLQAQADAAGLLDWRVSADSTIARVHQHGATAARPSVSPRSYTGGGFELQESAASRGRTGRSRHRPVAGWVDHQDARAG